MPEYVLLSAGDPAPWFRQRTSINPDFALDTVGGRYLVLCFFASARSAHARAAIEAALARADLFDDAFASFFGVSCDPADLAEGRAAQRVPGVRHFWDFDGRVSRLYGVLPHDAGPETPALPARPIWVLLDPTLRIIDVIPFAEDRSDIDRALRRLDALPPPRRFAGVELQAPVILLPGVFEPELCARLIALYEAEGGVESGFMREVDGKTVGVHDHAHKRRRDCLIEDRDLITLLQRRFMRRVVPEIRKVHQFEVTRMERYIVACYDAADGAHFRAHRDNTTKGTAHRRFAVSVNLNAEFEGGEVSFPEYGPRSFKPPPGGAVVFSCSLLHAVSRVTAGRRYAFLPFLYDDAAAELRERNNAFLDEKVGAYRRA